MRLKSNEFIHTILYLRLWHRFLFKTIFFTSQIFFFGSGSSTSQHLQYAVV